MTCQSAPPGSTRPERRSPLKRPPVIGITRRRPSGVAPSSCAGARVISARKSARRFNGFEEAEQLAKGVRGLALLLLLSTVSYGSSYLLKIGSRVLRGELGQRRVVGEQPLAPGFQAPVARGGLRRMALDRGEALADRPGVDLAHEAADVLQLPALRLVAAHALRLEHGLLERGLEPHRRDLRLGKLHQLASELLQLEHLLLALRLADGFFLHAVIIARHAEAARFHLRRSGAARAGAGGARSR